MNPNPKTPQDLDPKLKEAYDRVMGGNYSPSTPTTPNPIPKLETVPVPVTTSPPSTPLTNPMPINVPPSMPPLSAMSPSTAPLNEQPIASAKKKSKLSPIIFLVIGLAFFAIYAVVWGKIFKLF